MAADAAGVYMLGRQGPEFVSELRRIGRVALRNRTVQILHSEARGALPPLGILIGGAIGYVARSPGLGADGILGIMGTGAGLGGMTGSLLLEIEGIAWEYFNGRPVQLSSLCYPLGGVLGGTIGWVAAGPMGSMLGMTVGGAIGTIMKICLVAGERLQHPHTD